MHLLPPPSPPHKSPPQQDPTRSQVRCNQPKRALCRRRGRNHGQVSVPHRGHRQEPVLLFWANEPTGRRDRRRAHPLWHVRRIQGVAGCGGGQTYKLESRHWQQSKEQQEPRGDKIKSPLLQQLKEQGAQLDKNR
eukprot:365716-Chlamydomonas_euryale.AAC.6